MMTKMTPENVRIWQRIARDILTWALGLGIILFQAIAHPLDPNIPWIGTGLTLAGIPSALRINESRQNKDGVKEDDK